mgnify:CR=1 FL=1
MDPMLIEIPRRIDTARLMMRCPRNGDGLLLQAMQTETMAGLRPWMHWAQEPPKPAEVPMADAEKPAKEQTIYIPYTKLRQIFEKEGRGVFVPYDEFQRLWKAAAVAAKKLEDIKPALEAGMIYQFRATSIKDGVPISSTEDLKGVFIAE